MSGRILITGAAGFVGSALLSGFSKDGWSVTAIDRRAPDTSSGTPAHWIESDLGEPLSTELGRPDVVLHAAWTTASPRELGVSEAEYLSLNIVPLLTTLAFAERVRASAFVFLSSSGVFSPRDGSIGPEGRVGLRASDRASGRSPYAVAKRAGEALVGGLRRSVATHVVRLGHLFGPGERPSASRPGVSTLARLLEAGRAGAQLLVMDNDPVRDWTYGPDLAGAIQRLVGAGTGGAPVHLGSPHVRTDREIASEIARHFPRAFVEEGGFRAPTKPPMIPSDVVSDFPWTTPEEGIAALVATEGAA